MPLSFWAIFGFGVVPFAACAIGGRMALGLGWEKQPLG